MLLNDTGDKYSLGSDCGLMDYLYADTWSFQFSHVLAPTVIYFGYQECAQICLVYSTCLYGALSMYVGGFQIFTGRFSISSVPLGLCFHIDKISRSGLGHHVPHSSIVSIEEDQNTRLPRVYLPSPRLHLHELLLHGITERILLSSLMIMSIDQ